VFDESVRSVERGFESVSVLGRRTVRPVSCAVFERVVDRRARRKRNTRVMNAVSQFESPALAASRVGVLVAGNPPRNMTPRTPTGDRVDDEEGAPLLRSRTSARPNTAVWMSVSMVVAGALVLAVGAAPSVLSTGMALVNGATYHPESAAAEAAVLEAEVIQPDGKMLRREDVKAAFEVLDETEAIESESVSGAIVPGAGDELREEEEAEERRSVEKKQRRAGKRSADKEDEEPETRGPR
jgi:hypothetical protein